MCFFFRQAKSALEVQNRFKAEFERAPFEGEADYNGFRYPRVPVITNSDPGKIKLFGWGLIPHWAKDDSIKKYTLNARIETINEKPSFRGSVNKRCLIPADGFYEWQWLDEKGKRKQKHLLSFPGDELFAFAGLWSEWINRSTGELVNTCTILTTEANELLSRIHNSKKRMPVIPAKENEMKWLSGGMLATGNDGLMATPV